MRKTAAIGLLLLLLFNLFGYRLFFYVAELRHDARLAVRIDGARYDDEDLVELRVALPLPYMNDQHDFERVDGEITLEGKVYKYVKRKVEGGVLVLKVLPDRGSMAMNEIKHTFFKVTHEISDGETAGKGVPAKATVFKAFSAEYSDPLPSWKLSLLSTERQSAYPYLAVPLSDGVCDRAAKPPEAAGQA